MNKYNTKQKSQTFSYVAYLAVISLISNSCQFLACSDEAVPAMTNCSPSTNYDCLATDSFSPTCELHENLRNENYPVVARDEVGSILANLFMDLSETQEPLGAEFEKVLFENIWELYQS